MKIAIFGTVLKEKDIEFVGSFLRTLTNKVEKVYINEHYLQQIPPELIEKLTPETYLISERVPEDTNFLLSIGGDGTLLKTATLVKNEQIPVAGINVGRLGFLTSVNKEATNDLLDSLSSGDYIIDMRSLLELHSSSKLFERPVALNEFTIVKKDSSSMITIHTYINGNYMNSYWADGLIVSTPTGSTGYSLSCGGPILVPKSTSWVLTPVAPHNLNIRPLIIEDSSELTFKVEGRDKNFLCTLDSRHATINSTVDLKITKAKRKFPILRLKDANFYDKIREKLNWGLDMRDKEVSPPEI